MRIEEGKYYRTRDGRKVGPMRIECRGVEWEFEAEVDGQRVVDGTYCAWRADGSFNPFGRNPHRLDLISEWTEHSPIVTETVTTRRLEPGVYGPLRIWREISIPDCDRPDETPVREVEVSFAATNIDENGIELRPLNAPELRELARVALEIAEYLENA